MSRHASEKVLENLLNTMVAQHEIVVREDRIGLPTGPKLSNRERAVLESAQAEIVNAGPTPPVLKDLAEKRDYPLADLELLLQVAMDEGRLVRISPQLVLDRQALETLRKKLVEYFQTRSTGTVSELREYWGMTRKHAVPILEYFDECQVTSRNDDKRAAGPKLKEG
jgi:selenocysteine-specific elongation factor